MASKTGWYKAPSVYAPPKKKPVASMALSGGKGVGGTLNPSGKPMALPKDVKTDPWRSGWADVIAKANAAAPAQVTPAAPAPAKSAAPWDTDPQYQASYAGAARNRDDTNTGLDTERSSAISQYGYTNQFDDNGQAVGTPTVDPNNPFSKAAEMKRSYDHRKAGTNVGYANRGQLYAGSLVNAQNTNSRNELAGNDTLLKQLGSILSGVSSRKRTANTTFETTVGTAKGDALARAIGALNNG